MHSNIFSLNQRWNGIPAENTNEPIRLKKLDPESSAQLEEPTLFVELPGTAPDQSHQGRNGTRIYRF